MLGGYRDVVDVAIAGGYPDLTPEPADLEEEVAGYVAAGYQAIKVAAHGFTGGHRSAASSPQVPAATTPS